MTEYILFTIFLFQYLKYKTEECFADFGVFERSFGMWDFKCIFVTVLWKLGWIVTLSNNSNNNRSSCSSDNSNSAMTWSTTIFIIWVPSTYYQAWWLLTSVFYSTHRMCKLAPKKGHVYHWPNSTTPTYICTSKNKVIYTTIQQISTYKIQEMTEKQYWTNTVTKYT
jgi:hypothetical protein